MAWSKESSSSRGYGSQWRKLREIILARDMYLCQCDHCARRAVPLPATDVDHIVPKAKGGTDDQDNLRALSRECHKRITLEQQGKRYRHAVGLDGWPLPT